MASSFEPAKKSTYSSDMRYRMIWQQFAMEMPFRTIAHNLNVSVGTAYNICKLFGQTGDVNPSNPNRTNTRVLSDYDELVIIGLLMENPSLYLSEL